MIAMKKKILIIIVTIVLIVALVGGGIYAFLYFVTDLLKSDQELFYKYAAKNIDIINVIDDNWINAYKNKVSSTSYDNSGELKFSISNEDDDSQLNTAMNNVKFSFEGSIDSANNKSYQDIKLLYSDENKELFNVKFLKENDLYGLKTDEIVTKYVSVENNNIRELYNRLGIQNTNNIANKLEEYDFNNILNMSEESKEVIKQRYMSVLNSHIQSSSFSKEKRVSINVDGKEYSTNKYSLKLTGDELINVEIKLLETLLNDDDTLNEVVKILQKDDQYIRNLKSEIQDTIDNIRKQPSNENIALEIAVYESNGKLLRTEFIMDERNIIIENINNKESQNVSIVDTQTNKGTIITNYKLSRTTLKDNNAISLNINTIENDREASNVLIELTNKGDINSDTIETFVNINIQNDSGKTRAEYVNRKKFGVSPQIESLSENTVTLNNMTIEYNKNTIQAIQQRLQAIYEERANSVGLDANTLTSEIQYAIKLMREQFNRDEFEKQVQRSLNYIKQDAKVDQDYIKQLQKATTAEQKQIVKEQRLVKRLVEFGIDAKTAETSGRILIDSGYNYNYVYYIDYDKYTVTRAE